MRIKVVAAIAGLTWTAPAAAQAEAVAVAEAFLKAVLGGDVVAIRNLRTGDAAVAAGDIAGPMAQVEEVLLRFSQMKCSSERLAISPEPVAPDLLGLASVGKGDARWVGGTMSCPTATGQMKRNPIKLAVVGGKVAVFGF